MSEHTTIVIHDGSPSLIEGLLERIEEIETAGGQVVEYEVDFYDDGFFAGPSSFVLPPNLMRLIGLAQEADAILVTEIVHNSRFSQPIMHSAAFLRDDPEAELPSGYIVLPSKDYVSPAYTADIIDRPPPRPSRDLHKTETRIAPVINLFGRYTKDEN